MSRYVFIAGCARSGTTLMQDLMSCFQNTYVVPGESHFDRFDDATLPRGNVVVKRTHQTYQTLEHLPTNITLIYMLRHPFDTLTSHHPDFPKRRYYVSKRRWRDEYRALKMLRCRQPQRSIIYVRYSDLVSDPDGVQARIAESAGLEVQTSFSQSGETFFMNSSGRYERNPDAARYLRRMSDAVLTEIEEYCREFGFSLPVGFVKPGKFYRAAQTLGRGLKKVRKQFFRRAR